MLIFKRNILKKTLLIILKDYNYFLSKNLALTPQIIKDLIINSLNDFESFSKSLGYIKDILLYLEIIVNNIDQIHNISFLNNKTLIIDDNIIKGNKFEIETLCSYINKITEYQNNKKAKFVCFSNSFWNYYFQNKEIYNINLNSIYNLFQLRNCFEQYFKLKNILNENLEWDKNFTLPNRDEIGELLHKFIYIKINDNTEEKLSTIQKIELLLNKDPYYLEERYRYQRDPQIFQNIFLRLKI